MPIESPEFSMTSGASGCSYGLGARTISGS